MPGLPKYPSYYGILKLARTEQRREERGAVKFLTEMISFRCPLPWGVGREESDWDSSSSVIKPRTPLTELPSNMI